MNAVPFDTTTGKIWTVIPSAALNTSTEQVIFSSAYTTRYECLMACNEETRFTCVSFAFDTTTKDCLLYSSNIYGRDSYLKKDASEINKFYFESFNPGKCSLALLEGQLFGVTWNVSSEFDSTTRDKTKLPLQVKDGSFGYWRPLNSDNQPWIKVSFSTSLTISYFVIKGTGIQNQNAYVAKFSVESSLDNSNWKSIAWNYNNQLEYDGSFDNIYPRFYIFTSSLKVQFMKFNLLEKNDYFALQLELYGCSELLPECVSLPSSEIDVRGGDKKGKLKCFDDWTVIGQKLSRDDTWTKSWSDYKNGFETDKEFWAGNALLSYLTQFRINTARIDMWSVDGSHIHSEFYGIVIKSEADGYLKEINKFISGSGTASDFLLQETFNTYDSDSKSCAHNRRAGWWYSDDSCSTSNFFGPDSYWFVNKTDFRDNYEFQVNKFLFKIKPTTICKCMQ